MEFETDACPVVALWLFDVGVVVLVVVLTLQFPPCAAVPLFVFVVLPLQLAAGEPSGPADVVDELGRVVGTEDGGTELGGREGV